jgi:hypothetical protein
MKRKDDNDIQEKPIFTIEDTDHCGSSQEILEEPVITIEYDDEGDDTGSYVKVKKRSRLKTWGIRLLWFVATIIVVLACYKAIRIYNYYYNVGVSISVLPKDNIKKLNQMKPEGGTSEVVLKTDSVLGVAINIYELHNVKAEMTLVEPDTADRSVMMYVRTADYTATGKYLGSLVIDGEEKQSDVSRLGYCAIKGGNMVIGISRFDDMKDHMIDHDGSYFRQFMLVSNCELPRRFFLHGKVERKALARTANDRICIIETRHPETLWDFADALREYGFVDAIYLTGGNECGFYRAADGTAHYSGKAASYRTNKHQGIAPWLVLKKR